MGYVVTILKYTKNKMGKIAVLISGHLRNFNETIDNFKDNFISKLPQYDVYIHP